jgi:uncharacterized protein
MFMKVSIPSKITMAVFFSFCCVVLHAQTIGTFNSVQPSAQTQNFALPSTHTFQRIIATGNSLTLGGTLGANLDFTGYVPIAGSSTNGYLSVSSELTPAECAILSINFNGTTKLWNTTSSGKVNFPSADIGTVARFCSGTVTPNNTIMVCEESTVAGDVNADGYQDQGWVIEIDPVTRTVINQDAVGGVDKLWAVGRQSHENVVIKSDQSVMYWGADANPTGYMYKFVPTVAGNFSSGLLYVLVTNASLGTGTWQLVANSTQAEQNNTVAASTTLGAYNFNGIEDVELGPDGKVYFAAKGPGVIYRFNDDGTTVSNLEVFVASVNYDVDGAGPFAAEPWGIGNDNLAFDGEGNLWVLQDGSRNHIWVVGPTHTAATPAVKLFATTPAGSEPTGITFSPDYQFMFISFQHPSTANTASQTDAAGVNVVFNNHTTIVIARKEFLGIPVCANPSGLNSSSITTNSATVSWSALSAAVSYDVDYKDASSGTWINAVTATTSLSTSITGLTANTLYDWRVRANCTLSSSGYSAAQFTTSSLPSVCPGPYDVSTNGTLSGAATIPFNTDIKGLLNPANDNDYYKFVITTGGTITMTLTTLPANFHLRLLNSSGTTLQTSSNAGTTNETITRTVTAGTYYARVYPSNNKQWNAANCYTLKVQLGTAARVNPMVSLFPNPVKNKLMVSFDGFNLGAEIKVYSTMGNLLMVEKPNKLITELNISALPAGIYMITVNDGNKTSSLKFVKE